MRVGRDTDRVPYVDWTRNVDHHWSAIRSSTGALTPSSIFLLGKSAIRTQRYHRKDVGPTPMGTHPRRVCQRTRADLTYVKELPGYMKDAIRGRMSHVPQKATLIAAKAEFAFHESSAAQCDDCIGLSTSIPSLQWHILCCACRCVSSCVRGLSKSYAATKSKFEDRHFEMSCLVSDTGILFLFAGRNDYH